MIRAKNIRCYFRSFIKREAGKMVNKDTGEIIEWKDGYALEVDIYDPEETNQKNRLMTTILKLEENQTNNECYEKMRYLMPFTEFLVDLDLVVYKSGSLKINLDKVHLDTLGNTKAK